MFSIDKLKSDLERLGVERGDTLLVRADLGSIGKLTTKNRTDYIQFLLDTVGKEGTIIGLSFTKGFFIKKDTKTIFQDSTKSYTGAFANLMLKHTDAIRSTHPTNSYVGIGKHATYILENHNEDSGAYDPIRKIIELNGKMILIGCAGTSPGFTTTHLAEVDLGLHKRIIWPTLNGGLYYKEGQVRVFKRKDLGSCSSTFYRFYGFYIKEELLEQGYIGNAYSLLIDAQKAYDIDHAILRDNPKITICNEKSCMLCRARRWDNLKDLPLFFMRQVLKIITR